MKKILVVEDEVGILMGLIDNLEFEGYEVLTAKDGKTGLKLFMENNIDLILLDVMMPGMNGHEVCRKVKASNPEVPVIMITARNSEIDKVSGLDVGADDYITKPFSIPELMARIRAVLRRYNEINENLDEYSFADILLDFKSFKAFHGEKEIKLTRTEFEIMKYFIDHAGEVIHRHDFLNNVWGYEKVPTTRTVDNFIFDLRKKLESDHSNPVHIKSIRGVGYMFVPAPPDDHPTK